MTIIRDNWGIPHIYGATDADVAFGLLYAQAEDDFNRIEINYLKALGRLAEAMGEQEVYRDLRARLFVDEVQLKRLFAESPAWLRELMVAFADGLNYYLHTHPEVTPHVLQRFEPWMALAFSEGSIGADIERGISMNLLENFYGGTNKAAALRFSDDMDFVGSNGVAIGPAKSKNGNALLYLNPHTMHYYRHEAHLVSEEGLNAYGAITWGQFFIYQGFNARNGWMHTSHGADVFDEYREHITKKDGRYFYKHGDGETPVAERSITVGFKTERGMSSHTFVVYYTHHGPVVREENGYWISIRLMNRPITALVQSFKRTKTTSYKEFYEVMQLKSNSSNSTVYADANGNIAFFHGNFHPIRDTQFDWNHPVDGSDPNTDWKGLHSVEESIVLLNPKPGWLYHTNNTPFQITEPGFNPKPEDFPPYMARSFQNARGVHALKLFPGLKNLTIDSLIEAMYDSYLPTFAEIIPKLLSAYALADNGTQVKLDKPVALLAAWDLKSGVDSEAATLATFWGNELLQLKPSRKNAYSEYDFLRNDISQEQYLRALSTAVSVLEADYGTWRIPFGDIFRYQRLSGDIVQVFDDNAPSVPVGMASHHWGALAIFEVPKDKKRDKLKFYETQVDPRQNTKKRYGLGGQSWIAAVEFGDKVRAKALTAGGLNSVPGTKHFDDQLEMYAKGEFRDVHFYQEDIEANAEKTYHPGSKHMKPSYQ